MRIDLIPLEHHQVQYLMNVSPKKLVAGKRSYPMFTANYEDLLPLIDLIKTGRLTGARVRGLPNGFHDR